MQQSLFKAKIKKAFKLNFVPGIFLWFFALCIGLSYFFLPAAEGIFTILSDLKIKYGIWYSFFSTAFFGGIIPFCYLFYKKRIKGSAINVLLFSILFWAYKGVEVDLLYQLQSYMFGNGIGPVTLAKKIGVDQFIYGPLWAAPTMALSMLWMEGCFSWSLFKSNITKDFFTIQLPSVLFVNMMIWIPALVVIYMMPLALQIPISNLTLCFFVLLLNVVTEKEHVSN